MKLLDFPDNKHFPPLTILFLLLLLILICALSGAGLLFAIFAGQEEGFQDIMSNLSSDSSVGQRNEVRGALLLNHLTSFVLPPLLLAILLYRKQWIHFLDLEAWPSWTNVGLGSAFIICALPLVQVTYWLNKQLPIPAWAISMEDSTNELVNNMLVSTQAYELFFNLLVVAVVPAIGEELVFRGILQKQLDRLLSGPHLAIWLTALIFSAIHLQFEGFIPRMFLGALLGYLFYWTQNLWVPIIGHFMNNGLQVIALYFYQQDLSDYNPDQMDQVNWGLSIFSLIFVALLAYRLYHYNQQQLISPDAS